MEIVGKELKNCATCGNEMGVNNPARGKATVRDKGKLVDIIVCGPCSDAIQKQIDKDVASN